ncbi:lactose permease [Fusarium bulbicola]|nr:lactose permease [Fusarium bulbicola]
MVITTTSEVQMAAAMPESSVNTDRWWKSPNLRQLNLLLIIPMLSIFTQGFDGSMMNGLQSVEPWRQYFGEPKGSTLGLFNAAYPMGGLVAIPFLSFVSDTFGRRSALGLGASVCVIGASLQAAAQNLPMFVISRGVLGFGAVFIGSSGAPLITELAHPAHRATATALFNTSYSLGSIVAAWVTFGTFRIASSAAWRIPSGIQGLPSVIQLLGLWFVPESPRWLISKDRNEEALRILAKYHAEGNEEDALVQFEYNEIMNALSYERSIDRHSWVQNYLEFVRTKGNRKRLFILLWCACISQMSGNAFISYYLAPVLTSVGLTTSLKQTLINATQQILSWFSALYFATLPQKLGRRTLFLASLSAIFVCLVSITTGSAIFAKDQNNKAAGLYITEILPFNLRMRGQALYQLFATCFTLLSTYAIPVGLDDLAWKLYTIFIPWVVIEFAVIYFVFPETKGPSLEEIAIIFDGKDADASPVENKLDYVERAEVEHKI